MKPKQNPAITQLVITIDHHLAIKPQASDYLLHVLRTDAEVVKRNGLTHAPNRVGHPNRKNGGAWLIVRFTRESMVPVGTVLRPSYIAAIHALFGEDAVLPSGFQNALLLQNVTSLILLFLIGWLPVH